MDQWVSPGGCGWKMPWMITSTTLSTSSCRRNRFAVWVLAQMNTKNREWRRLFSSGGVRRASAHRVHHSHLWAVALTVLHQGRLWPMARCWSCLHYQLPGPDLTRATPPTHWYTLRHTVPPTGLHDVTLSSVKKVDQYLPFSRSCIHWFCSHIFWLIFAFTPTDLSGALWCC